MGRKPRAELNKEQILVVVGEYLRVANPKMYELYKPVLERKPREDLSDVINKYDDVRKYQRYANALNYYKKFQGEELEHRLTNLKFKDAEKEAYLRARLMG